MTTIYFVRHAEPNYNNHDDMSRELTAKEWSDRKRITAFLQDKRISRVYSSPFKRAVDTVGDFALKNHLEIKTDFNFRERKVGDQWLEDFDAFAKRQWGDFSYKLTNGESLREVQERNIKALKEILRDCEGENVVIGTHGTALSTIIAYYDSFAYEDFYRIQARLPWLVSMRFDGMNFVEWKEWELPEI